VDNARRGLPPLVEKPTFPNAQTTTAGAPQPISFINGSFENFSGEPKSNIPMADVPGWSTRPTSAAHDSDPSAFCIEIYPPSTYSPYTPTPLPDGRYLAELNAHVPGTLYQDCVTVPGTRIYYEFYHRGRSGTDTMDFFLYGVPNTSDLSIPGRDGFTSTAIKRCVDNNTAWGQYTGMYQVPAGQTLTRFAYQSVSSTGPSAGPAWGNFLDGIRLYTGSYLLLTKSSNAPGNKTDVGDTVTYNIRVKGHGESDASGVKIFDTLPLGMDFVTGSAKVGTTTVPSSYDPVTRIVTINAGLVRGSNSFSADCQNEIDVSFQVTVNGDAVAEDLKYHNQASAVYRDRYHENDPGMVDSVSYSNVYEISLDMRQPAATITDQLPAGLRILSHADAGGTYSWDAGTREIKWTWANLPVGETTVSVNVAVEDILPLYMNIAAFKLGDEPPVDTNKTWHTGLRVLRIRQVVLPGGGIGPASVELPNAGNFQMNNNGRKTSLLSSSYPLEAGAQPYTVYTLLKSADPIYGIRTIVPSHYNLVGWVLTDADVPHNPVAPALKTGAISLDYDANGEYWLTVYLRKRTLVGSYSWDYRTNNAGKIGRLL